MLRAARHGDGELDGDALYFLEAAIEDIAARLEASETSGNYRVTIPRKAVA